ncbi:hypothetical protein [Bosea sp. (in: a-proteobacteria)]|uniref:hypothetical protein n=1 Tax=Bosea sp. (in: a-proteobacteria) TaxID=1871050 RepID=UPI004033E132
MTEKDGAGKRGAVETAKTGHFLQVKAKAPWRDEPAHSTGNPKKSCRHASRPPIWRPVQINSTLILRIPQDSINSKFVLAPIAIADHNALAGHAVVAGAADRDRSHSKGSIVERRAGTRTAPEAANRAHFAAGLGPIFAPVPVTVVAIVGAPLRPSVRSAIDTLVFASIKATAPAALNAVASFTYKDSSGRAA